MCIAYPAMRLDQRGHAGAVRGGEPGLTRALAVPGVPIYYYLRDVADALALWEAPSRLLHPLHYVLLDVLCLRLAWKILYADNEFFAFGLFGEPFECGLNVVGQCGRAVRLLL